MPSFEQGRPKVECSTYQYRRSWGQALSTTEILPQDSGDRDDLPTVLVLMLYGVSAGMVGPTASLHKAVLSLCVAEGNQLDCPW